VAKAPCAVERVYEQMDEGDKSAFRDIILGQEFSAGYIAKLLLAAGYKGADRAAVGHYRRKLLIGKAKL
jgi:hypothetical protein